MPPSNRELVQRFVALFNRESFEWAGGPPSAEMSELFIKEPVIVPMYLSEREALEAAGR